MIVLVNGRGVTWADDPTINLVTEDKLELRGDKTIEMRGTELDKAGPAGRFRWRIEDGEWLFQRATYQTIPPRTSGEALEDAYWTTWETLLRMNSAGVTVDLDQDEQLTLLEELVEQVDLTYELLVSVLDA